MWRQLFAGIILILITSSAFAQGVLTGVAVTPSNPSAGAATVYTMTFTPDILGSGVPADGQIRFVFPANFDLSGVEIAQNVTGLDGGYAAITASNDTLVLQRDGTGTALAAGAPAILKLASVINSTQAADTFAVLVETLDNLGIAIDGPTSSATFAITAAVANQIRILVAASGDTSAFLTTAFTTGDTALIHAASFDIFGNYIQDETVNWSVSGGIGTVLPATGDSTLFTATTPGTGQIAADHPTLSDGVTAILTVSAGGLASIKIVEGPFGDGPELDTRTLTADETMTLHAAGYDAQGNYLGDQNVTWSSSGGLAPAVAATANTITFSPTTAPVTGIIIASHGTAGSDATGTITVNQGAANYVKVLSDASGNTNEVPTAGLTTGGQLTVHAASFDADGNYINDVSVSWNLSGGIGSLFPQSGVFTTFTAEKVGSGQITADHASLLDDATGTITVSAGTLAYIRIYEGPSGNTTEFSSTNLKADESLTLHAAGFDAQNNYIGDQTVAWSRTGTLAPAFSDVAPSITFNPTMAPATGTISASHGTAGSDATGTITVTVGNAHHIKVLNSTGGNTSEVNTAGLTAGDKLTVHAGSFDSDDNYIGDITVSWGVSGNIGTLSATLAIATELTATTPGSGQIFADDAGPLLGDATGVITVNAGSVASIKIVEGLSGDGPELAAKSLTADDILFVHAAGYDVQGNYVGDQSVTWGNTGTLMPTISATGTSAAFNPNTAPTSGTITASHATAGSDATGLISVTTGVQHHVKVLNGISGNTAEVTSVGLVTGDQLTVHAGSFDADDNYISDVSVDWDLSGGIGSLFPSSGMSTTFSATTAGTGQITADHPTLFDDATGTISVSAGSLAFVRIVEGTSGNGPELDTKTLSADQTLTVHAAGYDDNSNYIGDQNVTWTSTGSLAPVVNETSPTFTFNPTTAPASGTLSADHATATDDATGTITVLVGSQNRVKILDGPSGNTSEVTTAGLTTGGTLTVHASSFDADGNYIQDVSASWSVSGSIGTLSSPNGVATTLTATTPGSGIITADHATLVDDATGIITVNPGTLDYILIVEGPTGNGPELAAKNLTADEALTVHAAGYDAQGNYIGDQTVTWGSTGTLAPVISGSGTSFTFSPTTAPAFGTITADHATATDDATGTISVDVGTAHRVKVLSNISGNTSEVSTAGLTTGGTLTVHAASFDADNNYIQDVVVGWSVSGGIGLLSANNDISTILTATAPGSGQITADHPTLIDDATGTITVNSGSLAFIKIVEGPGGNGPELNTKSLTADDVLTVHAAGYDAQGNYIGDQTVTWASLGTLAPVLSGSGPSITFNPTTAPTAGTISATHTTAGSDATGTITVGVGSPSRVKVLSGVSGNTAELTSAGLTTGGTLVMHAASFDADNNYVQDVSVAWSVSGGIGATNPATGISTTLTATTPGTGQVTADHPVLIDDATGTISVSAGTLASIRIVDGPSGNTAEVTTLNLTADNAVTVHAAGYDAQGNYIGDQTVDWAASGSLTPAPSGTSTSFTFNPTLAPASGKIAATHATAGTDSTDLVSVSVGSAHHIKVLAATSGETSEVNLESLATGDSLDVHAASFDADDNYLADVSVGWSVSGGIGSLAPLNGVATRLTATTPGTGQITADHPTLIDDATGTITVASSGLAYVRIVEGPAGDGPELTTRSLTADQTLTVHAAGYDANGNYLGDQEVAWGSTGTLSPPLNGTATSITFSPTTAPATGAITADHPTADDDNTGTISVGVGGAQRIKVLSGASGSTNEVLTNGLTTGGALVVHASSFDADNNYITDVSVDWTVTGGIGSLTNAVGVTTTLIATTPGTGVISADHTNLIDDATGTITVSAGSLAYIKIVEGASGNTPEAAGLNLTADQSITVHAAGFDANDNYLGDQTVVWSSSGSLGPEVTGSGTSIVFSPTLAPASGRIFADHPTAADDSTGVIAIAVGSAQRIKVLSNASGNTSEVTSSGLTTTGTLTVHASSFDADDNYITDVAVNWSVNGGIGTVAPALNSSSTTFTATTPGTGVISADHPTLIDDATGTITVSSGTLAYILIFEGPSGNTREVDTENLTADQTLTVHAAGFDASDNYIGDQTVTWGSTGNLAPAISATSSALTFSPTTAPASGVITATHLTANDDATGTIAVAVGQERYVSVLQNGSGNTPEVGNVSLTTGETLVVHASSFDADNNYVQDVAVAWLLSGNIGTLNPTTGISTTLTASTAGSGVITADHPAIIDDATGSINISAGTLSYIKIVEGPVGDGPELGARTLTTDDILQVHAAGYDAQDNYIGDQPVNWSVTGGIGTLNPVFGATTSLRLTSPGSGQLIADHASANDDSSGVLTVGGGSLYRIKVLIGASGNTPVVTSHGMTTDDVFTVHAGGFDINDNYLGDFSVNWSVSGNIGTLNPVSGLSTTLNANKVGNGQIQADHATAIDGQSGIISVSAGGLNFIKVVEGPSGDGTELGARTLTADQTLTVHAAGFDADSNYVGDQNVAWSSTGTLAPAISATGTNITFAPTTAPVSGAITATHASAGTDETGTVTVTVGVLHHVTVLSGGSGNTAPVTATTLNPGQTLGVHAGGFDADNNYISDQSVNWSVIGPIGNIAPASGISATFAAQTVGTGTIRADASGAILDGVSETITVALGNVARIRIRTAPNNGGSEFGNFNMTADDDVTLYAAGYDAGDNYFGDVSVNWSSTGSLSPQVSATGSSFTFSPAAGHADGTINGTIIAAHASGGNDTTGSITVLPGDPVGEITLTASPSGLPADGSSTSLLTSSVIRDAENNDVGANKLFTVTITPSNLGTIATPDADPATPGHQIATNSSSRLSFTFRAGSAGGIATIGVSSGLAASGNTQISMGSLNILSVSTTPNFVSQSQTGVAVSMTIQNLAASPVTNLDGQLTFTGAADRTGEYTVSPSAGNPTSVSGSSTATLTYLVDISANATLEQVTINGSVAGDIGGSQVSTVGAATPDSWTVQRAAGVALTSVVTALDTVSQGQQNISFTVQAANSLGLSNVADAVVDSVRLVFRQGPVDKSAEYIVAANPANPTVIAGNSTATFSFTVNVGLTATPGDLTIDATIYARDGNSNRAISDLNANTTDSWVVVEADAFNIVAIVPSQPTVTAGMIKAWQIQMLVQNSGSSNISVDLNAASTFLRLFIGSMDVTSEYTIGQPIAFDQGGNTLGPGATGTLTFPVTQTGSSTGIATISGFAAGLDNSTGLPISDNTNDGGTGDVRVQTLGALNITGLQLSQPSVTQNRDFDWTITATVTNNGESAIKLNSNPPAVSVGNSTGYQFIQPRSFIDGDSILAGNQTKQYRITVDQTGSQLGTLPVSLMLAGVETNSDRAVQSNTGGTNVISQSPAVMQIREVRVSRQTVTAGQTNPWDVVVVVENTGQSQVSLKNDATTNLRFRLNSIFQNDYSFALQPANWLGTSSLILAGNATDSLRFEISTTGSNSGFPELWATVNATETNSQTNITGADNGSTSFQVQTAPVVSYIAQSMVPDIVNNNGFYAFTVRVNNAGQSTVALQPSITTFEFTDGSNPVSPTLDANKVVSLPPGDTTLTFQQVQIPANMAQQSYTPTIRLRGTENGNGFSRDLPVDVNELQVTAPSDVQILATRPSQPSVTRAMEKDWTITMLVRNNGGTAVQLDSVKLILFNGGDVTGEYSLVTPTQFLGSGGDVLSPGATDSLQFDILKTGNKEGSTTIQGRLWVTDQSSQQQLFIQSDTGGGSFDVQGPASLAITQITTSQPRVTQNMTVSWTIDVALRNNGASDLGLLLDPDSSNVALALDAGDYQITYPATLVGGDTTLEGNSEDILRFIVTQTGAQMGANIITAEMRAIELNSDVHYFTATTPANQGSVVVETPAQLRIKAVTVTGAPNLPQVNTNQPFTVNVEIENIGQETADSIRVALASNGSSAIVPTSILIDGNIPGNATQFIQFGITASASANPGELFTANLISARARNTRQNASFGAPVDNNETVIVQLPAVLQVADVQTSVASVAAEQNIPWQIYVILRNNGTASLDLAAPDARDIAFSIASNAQLDYTVEAPAELAGGGLTLAGGAADTLKYIVRNTGRLGGTVDIVASAAGADRNTTQALNAQGAGSIVVSSTAAVRILQTVLTVNNTLGSTETGLVNTDQTFSVRVVAENRGLEDLENVDISLSTNGGSSIPVSGQTIATIPVGETREAVFQIIAAALPTSGTSSEVFTATIVSATAAQSQEPATIFLPADNNAQVQIQTPASLAISASTDDDDNVLSSNQLFEITAMVANSGQADIDGNGRVTLEPPTGFVLVDPNPSAFEQAFAADQPVVWRVRAPATAVASAQFKVRLNQAPFDRNAASEAVVTLDSAAFSVQVVEFDLAITKLYVSEPGGAEDDTLSTQQNFIITANIAFSADLAGQQRSITLAIPNGYQLLSAATIDDFSETASWQLIAPAEPHAARAFIATAEGVTGLGEQKISKDTLQVALVSRALVELSAFISEPPGAQDGILSQGQPFTIRANLNNRGTAAALDSGIVRLELGQTGVTTTDALEQKISTGANGFVEWQAVAPNALAEGEIVVRLIQRPIDENTDFDAAIVRETSQFNVRTVDAGNISASNVQIIEPVGATDGIVSTNQQFTVRADLDWQNVQDVTARLLLPAGFSTENEFRSYTALDGPVSPTWIVRAPVAATAAQLIRVSLQGNDANNDTVSVSTTSAPLQVDVVDRALLRLSAAIVGPPAALDGIVSVSQEFDISGEIVNNGQANVVGIDSMRLVLPTGYSATEPLVKASSNGVVGWRVRARSTPSPGSESITLRLVRRPTDENTNLPADVENDEVAIPIQAEPKRMRVTSLPLASPGPTAAGQADLVMMRLVVLNLGTESSSDILLRGISFFAENRFGEEVPPNAAFKRLRVTGAGNLSQVYAEIAPLPGENPLTATFATFDTLAGGIPDTIDIVVDIADNPQATDFQIAIRSSEAFDAIDADSRQQVVVEDELGRTGIDFAMLSASSAVSAADYNEFFNYPNPFRPSEGTWFNYYLPQASQVDFRILTLAGELVWQQTFEASSPQAIQGARRGTNSRIFWDGRNGNGELVLNGVYIAVLKTSAGVVTTKVAVAK
ncbi:MAG: hypothetical protein H6695_06170 [Deferribacteres bacterium]|nr:hypothetical protein [Deferribacteres bacterium]